MNKKPKETTEVLLKEKRTFDPSKDLIKNSNVRQWMDEHEIDSVEELYEKAKDQEWFWGTLAEEELEWFEKWDKVLSGESPYFEWFKGAKTNIVHNALDRHVKTWRKNKVAFIWEGEPGDVKKYTYYDLYQEVNKLANALKHLGVGKGDVVGIYLPMIPELPIAMLACAKIGAVHSVVFSGFSAKALRGRLNDASVKVLITCDGYYRAGKVLNLKKDADEALMNVRTVEDVLVVNRMGKNLKIPLINGRDEWYHDLIDGQSAKCKTEVMDAEDLLFLLYTSGTTGKPKGVMHTHAGYALGTHVTTKWVFDMKGEDIYWCIADIGWITGHSYVVYGPLSVGATSVIYVGAPVYPHPNRPFEIVEKYGVTVYYSTPTAIRLFMHYGEEWPRRHDLSSLRLLGAVGEPLNPEAWMWFYKHIGQEKCPIMDTWWQTETGMHLITPLPILPLKPGSTTLPFPGIEADVLNEKGESLSYKEGGHLVIKTPC
jgi:acetyl-CoA synthetase